MLTKVGAYTNEATVTGESVGGIPLTQTSNQVLVEVPAKPAFTIVKLQEINSSGLGFTTTQLTGAIGQAVNYEIIVTNTGNVPLKFGKLSDANCENITPAGEEEIAPTAHEAYTCNHVLTKVGAYTNEATVTGTPESGTPVITHTSNQVVVEVPSKPAFTIEKLQKLAGEPSFTKSELAGTIGQTVDYEIVIENTGNVPLKFSSFSDPTCEGITGGPGSSPVAPEESTTYTCTHTLTSVGAWTNKASVEGDEGTGPKISNEVIVNVKAPPEPSFVIEKLQKLAGELSVTKSPLTGKIGQTVDYEIVIENTGNVPLTFSSFSDPNCEGITGGPGSSAVVHGESTTYTCTHTLTSVGAWTNEASVEGDEGTSTKTSNKVVVNVPAEPSFTIEKLQEIKGSGTGFRSLELTGDVDQTVDYEIVVKNTGNVPLTFSSFSDPTAKASSGGPGSSEVAPGESTTYTCDPHADEHRLLHERGLGHGRPGRRHADLARIEQGRGGSAGIRGYAEKRNFADGRGQPAASHTENRGPRRMRKVGAIAGSVRTQAPDLHGADQLDRGQADHVLPRRPQARDARAVAGQARHVHTQDQPAQAVLRSAQAVGQDALEQPKLQGAGALQLVRAPLLGARCAAFHRLTSDDFERRADLNHLPQAGDVGVAQPDAAM